MPAQDKDPEHSQRVRRALAASVLFYGAVVLCLSPYRRIALDSDNVSGQSFLNESGDLSTKT